MPILVAALAASATLACVQVHHLDPVPRSARVEKPGPPPHAPAHGYRHKHKTHAGEVQLVFDSGLGLYLVVGWPGHFYDTGHYYRKADGVWLISTRLDTGWVAVSAKKLPPGLAKKGRGPKKGPHPASHRR
jgi:hypothetical protein